MKRLFICVFLITFASVAFAEDFDYGISVNGQVTMFRSKDEFDIVMVSIQREMRTVCQQGVPVYFSLIANFNKSPYTFIHIWEVTRNIPTDEQLRIAVREGYWADHGTKWVPAGTGNFDNLRRGNYSYLKIKGGHYVEELVRVGINDF